MQQPIKSHHHPFSIHIIYPLCCCCSFINAWKRVVGSWQATAPLSWILHRRTGHRKKRIAMNKRFCLLLSTTLTLPKLGCFSEMLFEATRPREYDVEKISMVLSMGSLNLDDYFFLWYHQLSSTPSKGQPCPHCTTYIYSNYCLSKWAFPHLPHSS